MTGSGPDKLEAATALAESVVYRAADGASLALVFGCAPPQVAIAVEEIPLAWW